jgi:TolB protein
MKIYYRINLSCWLLFFLCGLSLFVSGCLQEYTRTDSKKFLPLDSITELSQLTTHKSKDMYPVISSDGKNIAFLSDKQGNDDIFVVDLSGKNPRQLTIQESDERNPTWTSDGKSILFDSSMLGNTAIFKINLKNERIVHQLIARGASDSAPDISPNGNKIAFSTTSGTAESLWIADIDGRNLKQIGVGNFPKWSPDGKSILFTSSKGGNFDIWLVQPDGSDLMQITVDTAQDVSPAWSPDGKKIAFSSNRSGNFELWLIDLETGELIQLTNHPEEDGGPAWSSDGRNIYFHSNRSGNMDLWKLTPQLH